MRPLPTPATVHPPLSVYSHAVEVDPGERLLVLSGQVGMAPDGTVPADPVDQADRAFTNLEAVLAAGGMAVTDLVKLTFYLVGDVDLPGWRACVASHLGDHRPTMTLLFVARLASPSLRVEIEGWAAAPAGR
jgi:enamine deaminase RidA (YjgF/YER057c/UK114 family)